MPTRPSPFHGSFQELKERQLLFRLVRELAEAQFVRADRGRTERLWQEAALLELDPERILALLYGVGDHHDEAEMEALDRCHREAAKTAGRDWLGRKAHRPLRTGIRGGGRRSAPPAAAQAPRAVR